jgi:hypothetical protein
MCNFVEDLQVAELDEDLRQLEELDSFSDQNKKGPPDPFSAKFANAKASLHVDSVSVHTASGSSKSNNLFLFAKESRFFVQTGP